MIKQQPDILKKLYEGKEMTSEEVIDGFTVRTYGHLNVERLVKNLLKHEEIVGHKVRNS